ncbi:MAG: lysylphosphatidylglycerol synthase domain-containing protein, partial [Gemmatimonadota bacterium]
MSEGRQGRRWASLAFRVLSIAAGMGATVWVAARLGASPADLVGIPPTAHLLALAAMAVEMGGRAARVRLLAGALGVPLRFSTALRAQFAADAAGAVTPSKIGADPAKLWIMGADGGSLGGRGAVLLGEMAWEASVLLVVALGLILFAPISRAVPLAILSYAAMIFILASLAIWAARSAGSDPPGWWTTLRLTPARWRSLQEQGRAFTEHARDLRRIPWPVNVGVLATTLAHMAARILVLAALIQGWTGIPEGGLVPLIRWPFALLYLGTLLPPPGGGGVLEVG